MLLFGSLNLFAIGLVGEYLARVFEEVKRRPLYVRSSIVRDGEVRLVSPSVDARSASLAGMIARRRRALAARACPVCGATGGRELAPARIDAAALDEYAFASRKFPEYMHHRLVECAICDAVYASPVPDVGGIDAAYDAAAFDSKEEAVFASRTYAGLVRPLLPRLPRPRSALDIGTGEGSFLEELLDLGFEQRARLRAVGGAARRGLAARPRADRPRRLRRARCGRGSGPYDLITCCMTIEHVPDPAQLCRDAHGLLAPGRRADARLPRPPGAAQPRCSARARRSWTSSTCSCSRRPACARCSSAAGFDGVRVRRITNRYPLHYWLKLAPVPRAPQAGARRRRAPRRRCARSRSPCRSATSPAIGFRQR